MGEIMQTLFETHTRNICAPIHQHQSVLIFATKAVNKKVDVLLVKEVEGVGEAGSIVKANAAFMRNYLFPKGLALPMNDERAREILATLEKTKNDQLELEAKYKAKSIAIQTALATIGKFVIKKKGNDNKLFGSVSA